MFLNDCDIDVIVRQTRADGYGFERPNLAHAAVTIERLNVWANNNSDGWAYWKKPGNASKRLGEHLYREFLGRYDERTGKDITDAELVACNRPIKAFLTRTGVHHTWSDGALRTVGDIR